jgi:uncharacterized protein Yka (UPF0111/DUF47 family)
MLNTAYAAGATDKQVILTAYTAATGEPYTAGAFNTSGLALRYRRAGANTVATITPVTQTISGAHTDGGFVHLEGGRYRVDLPDAAIAVGADYVVVWAYGVTGVVFTTASVDILGGDPRGTEVSVDAASVRAAIGLASANLDTQIAAVQADTDNIQTRLPAALVSGRMDVSVGAMAANVMTAAAAAADLTTELQSGLATAAALAVVDSEIAAIQADTDNIQTRLPAALVGGRMDVSVGAMAANVMTAAAAAADLTTELQSGLATAAALAVVDSEIAALQASANAIEADTQDLQSRVPAALVGGRIDASVGAMAANVMTAAAAAPDLTTELQSGLATQALLTTVAGYVDTEITAIANAIAAQNNLSAAQVRAELAVELARLDAAVSSRAVAGDIPTAAANADALLGRSIAGGANGGRTVTSALRRLRNRVRILGGTMTVYAEDDSTTDHTAAVTTAEGNPISEVDPA